MNPHWSNMTSLNAPYRWTMLGGILLRAAWWFWKSKRDPAMLPVYIGALGGAFLGAKLVYLFAEGWRDWSMEDRWLRLAAGKSILGGLLGGYLGVELMKKLLDYRKSTGDLFAIIAPVGIAIGRVGCCLQGCCGGRCVKSGWAVMQAGVARWPSAQVELGFQLLMLVVILILHKRGTFKDRLFFLYLAAYGIFRFFHEWLRETPQMAFGVSGYQIIAAIMAALGAFMFWKRRKTS